MDVLRTLEQLQTSNGSAADGVLREHALDGQQAGIDGQLDGGVQGSGIGFQCPREPDVLRYGDSVPQRGVGQQDRYEAEIVE